MRPALNRWDSFLTKELDFCPSSRNPASVLSDQVIPDLLLAPKAAVIQTANTSKFQMKELECQMFQISDTFENQTKCPDFVWCPKFKMAAKVKLAKDSFILY